MTQPEVLATLWAIALVAAIAIGWWATLRRASRTRWRRLVDDMDDPISTGSRAPLRVWARSAAFHAWRHPLTNRWGAVLTGALGSSAGLLAAGPVAAVVFGAYGVTGFALIRGREVRRSCRRGQRMAMDGVVALAEDLRAGVAVNQALRTAQDALDRATSSVLPHRRNAGDSIELLTRRVTSALAVSRASGAPLAEVLERLDAHVRAADRGRALVEAHAAGARASAALLAAMPAAGVGLGIAIGVDPLRVLLRTGLGAAALCIAVALQLAGLAWTTRLVRVEVSV
jgi:tight adherence protein B